MKKKDAANDLPLSPMLARVLPETYGDVIGLLLEHFPFLGMPCMHDTLVKKALFFTEYVVYLSDDMEWDVKAEYGEDVETSISFLENPPDSEFGARDFDEIRRWENYTFLEKIIRDYERGMVTTQRLRLKLKSRK
ncbi:MAG: hypothetical protein WC791_01095 [Candidatus Paceibacterota bacterium]|jgi:hypothetical protein